MASRPEIQILRRLFPAYFPTGGNPVNSLITRPASKRTKKGSHRRRRRRRRRRCGTRCIVLLAGLMDEHPGSMGWRVGGGLMLPCGLLFLFLPCGNKYPFPMLLLPPPATRFEHSRGRRDREDGASDVRACN